MLAVWFRGHSDKETRTKEIMACRNSFDILRDTLEKHYRKKPADLDYGTPGWEFRQIAVNEYNRVLDDILKLIDLNKE